MLLSSLNSALSTCSAVHFGASPPVSVASVWVLISPSRAWRCSFSVIAVGLRERRLRVQRHGAGQLGILRGRLPGPARLAGLGDQLA